MMIILSNFKFNLIKFEIGKISPIDYWCNLRNTNLKILNMIINMNIHSISWLIPLILKKINDVFTITITPI